MEEELPPPVTAVNAAGGSPLVLLCEHASNFIPARYAGLGLMERDLTRHIAWDPGAAPLARLLSERLDAPLFLSGYSRLLIDCNRPPGAPTSIPVRSEATDIPGNAAITPEERAAREAAYFLPFRDAVAAHLDARQAAGRPTLLLGVHSFTPVFLGEVRPWQAGILYAGAKDFAAALLDGLRAQPDLTVGDNEPYRIEPEHDHTVPVHGDARSIPAALLEIRQDLIADDAGVAEWADRLTPMLARITRQAPALGG
ncbi:N-formylglutamate amidohydrolase [Roseomonas sp. OT10]|uniref:N-formylglutamate amidohydrolase n=1 Tax=Roseomonas cutis TaxID=2897332 RepID=UPI001E2D6C6D|nr:N-formylglutamate amidohydrolase [Roseomonas sp. OT10]UFN48009.1 N-formylglutamate amidohydrolase [Roseomonas sp. OT10]